jgi:hypothetical protein
VSTLSTHQAFVRIVNSDDLHLPVWFEPQFFTPPVPEQQSESIDSLHAARIRLRDIKRLGGSHERIQQACEFLKYMQLRHPLRLTPSILGTALSEFPVRLKPPIEAILRILDLDGIETLPPRWISAILPWVQAHPDVLKGLMFANGILLLDLKENLTFPKSRLLRVQEELNLRVYPSLWKPLQKRHRLFIEAKYPELADALNSAVSRRNRKGTRKRAQSMVML